MAKRKQREEEPRELTRKEVRLRARDRERNRRLYWGAGIAIGLALLLVVIGAIMQFAVRPTRAIATVGSDAIITRDYWKRLRFEKQQMIGQLVQMQQLEQQFGQGVFGNQIQQLQSTLSSPFALGVQVLDRIIDEKVVAQQAAVRNITVSDQEVEDTLRAEIANRRGAITVPQATSTAEAAVEQTATASSWTPTPAPTIDVSSTITATATPLPTPEPPATRAIISDTGFSEGQTQLTEDLVAAGELTLDEYKQIIRSRLLAEKLEKAIGEEKVQANEEQVKARHILIRINEPTPAPTTTLPTTATTPITAVATPVAVPAEPVTATSDLTTTPAITTGGVISGSEGITATAAISPSQPVSPTAPFDKNAPRSDAEAKALAEDLRKRLQAGEDFAQLAAIYSDDTGSGLQGGDLGWFGKGRMVKPFEDAAFSLPLNQVSEPIKTDFGYHLIEVQEKDSNRTKEEAQLQQERRQAYQTWLQEQKTATTIDRPQDIESYLPSDITNPPPVENPEPSQ